jgi:hypothetical protein
MSFLDFATLVADMKATLVARGYPQIALQEVDLEEVVFAARRTGDPEAYITAWLDERYPAPE